MAGALTRTSRVAHTDKRPERCPHCGSTHVTRKGMRKKKIEIVQLWRCASCKRVFTPAPEALRDKTYPFTALNLLPSIATTARVKSLSLRQSSTNCPHTARIAAPLSLRKSAIVLKSGASRPTNHINSILRCASRSQPPARLETVEVAVEVYLQQRRGRPTRRRRRHP